MLYQKHSMLTASGEDASFGSDKGKGVGISCSTGLAEVS